MKTARNHECWDVKLVGLVLEAFISEAQPGFTGYFAIVDLRVKEF